MLRLHSDMRCSLFLLVAVILVVPYHVMAANDVSVLCASKTILTTNCTVQGRKACLRQPAYDGNGCMEIAVSVPLGEMLMVGKGNITLIDSLPAGLSHIDLTGNPLTSISGVTWPETLRELRLASTSLTDLLGVKWPPNLQNLILDRNDIKTINVEAWPQTLIQLSLQNNTGLSCLPKAVHNSSSLSLLYLGGTAVSCVPRRFAVPGNPPACEGDGTTISSACTDPPQSVNDGKEKKKSGGVRAIPVLPLSIGIAVIAMAAGMF